MALTHRRRLIAIAALVLAVVAGLAVTGAGARLLSPAGSTVAEYTGTGSTTTSSFSVRDGWSIQWESSGQTFAMAIGGDRDFGTVIENPGPGSGVTSPVGSGTFHLQIVAQGSWRVTVIQGD